MLHFSQISDQLDVTLESSKRVKMALTWVATIPSDANQIKIMPFIQTSLAQSESASPKTTTLYVYNMSLFLIACLSAKQMAKSKQFKVPTKQGQRLDHATKLEASLPRHR